MSVFVGVLGFTDLNPEDIYFSHARIRPFFSGCGRRLAVTLDSILKDETKVGDIPVISVISVEDYYVSLNNRRLWVFKELRAQGKVDKVRVRVKEASPKDRVRYAKGRLSLTAKIMKEYKKNPVQKVAGKVGDKQLEDSVAATSEKPKAPAQSHAINSVSSAKPSVSQKTQKLSDEILRSVNKLRKLICRKGGRKHVQSQIDEWIEDGLLCVDQEEQVWELLS